MKLALSRPCCNRSAIHESVLDVRLSPGNRFDMLCIDNQHFKMAFQQVEHRFPIHTRCLEGNMGTPLFTEPITELQQLFCRRKVGPKCFARLAGGGLSQYTDLDRLLMHVQPGAVGIEDFHSCRSYALLLNAQSTLRLGWAETKILFCVLLRRTAPQGNKGWFLHPPRSVSWSGSGGTICARSLCRNISSSFYPFS